MTKKYRQLEDSNIETKNLIFCIAPDGSLTYAWDSDSAAEAAKIWREGLTDEQRKAHEDAHTMGGFILVRMLKSDFDKLEMTYAGAVAEGGVNLKPGSLNCPMPS